MYGRAGPHVADGFFVYMSDTNSGVPGSLLVHMMNSGGRSTSIFVRAFGSGEGASEDFGGRGWQRASTEERSAKAKAALIRLAKRAAIECDGQMSSLTDELETFDAAFAAFDNRGPF